MGVLETRSGPAGSFIKDALSLINYQRETVFDESRFLPRWDRKPGWIGPFGSPVLIVTVNTFIGATVRPGREPRKRIAKIKGQSTEIKAELKMLQNAASSVCAK